jgi:hypothetical protein
MIPKRTTGAGPTDCCTGVAGPEKEIGGIGFMALIAPLVGEYSPSFSPAGETDFGQNRRENEKSCTETVMGGGRVCRPCPAGTIPYCPACRSGLSRGANIPSLIRLSIMLIRRASSATIRTTLRGLRPLRQGLQAGKRSALRRPGDPDLGGTLRGHPATAGPISIPPWRPGRLHRAR